MEKMSRTTIVSADNLKHKTAIGNNEMDNFAITCGTIIVT